MRDGIAITRIRIGASGRVRISTARARVVIDITPSDLTIVIGDGPTIEVRASGTASRKRLKGGRSLAAPTFVSPEMEMAAVNAFLGEADTVRLGRSQVARILNQGSPMAMPSALASAVRAIAHPSLCAAQHPLDLYRGAPWGLRKDMLDQAQHRSGPI